MLNQHEIERYKRQISLAEIGYSGQMKLKQARVLVVGAGGLGCPALQYLTAAGIGTIGIIDGDLVSMSNLQRQILFSANDLNKSKACVVKERLKQINPNTIITEYSFFLNAKTALEIFQHYDLVVDCTDNFECRYIINDVCVMYHLPFVSAAIYHFEGQLACYNVPQNNGDYSCNYRDVYPEIPDAGVHLNCNDAGVMATLPGLIGLYQANEVLKFFLNKKTCLANELLFVNVWNMHHFTLQIEKNAENKTMSRAEILNYSYATLCTSTQKFTTLNKDSLHSLPLSVLWVDVREKHELPSINNSKIIVLPLSKIEQKKQLLNNFNEIAFFCMSGIRSAKAAKYISEIFPDKKIFNYVGELNHLISLFNEKRELV
jgi:molybdopterin/thiamine biosynthesis adenylyltransferase/rhodanese-related sulfurtransferase